MNGAEDSQGLAQDLIARITPGVAGVVWPALPGPSGANMLALQFQLERSQWWPAPVLARHQRRQLAALLDHARRTVPWYEEQLAGLDPAAGIDGDAFAALPTLSRERVQTDADALRSRALPAGHGEPIAFTTSGSTARPLRVLRSRLDHFWWGAITLRDHLWHARDLGGKLAVIRTAVEPHTAPGWGAATDGMFATGPCALLNIGTDIHAQAHWLAAEDPDYLLSHPSNLLALARHCEANGVRPARLREVRSFGEALPADLRDTCARAFGVPVTDCYSANETGYLALQCPTGPHYHVQAESVFVEVLDDANRPCGPGQIGRVVVTPLHNYAMPLIRYELLDHARVGAPCACGRGLPVLARIMGRRRNMLRLPDGTTHWPSFPAQMWLPFTAIRQFQLVQTTPEHITVRLAVTRALREAERRDLCAALAQRLGWPLRFTIEYVDRIGGGPKFEDFVSLLEQAP